MMVKVGEFTFPVDFMVMEMEEDTEVPLICVSPFMKTVKVGIGVDDGNMRVRAQEEEVTFDVFGNLSSSIKGKDCLIIHTEQENTSGTCNIPSLFKEEKKLKRTKIKKKGRLNIN